jgi:putative mRNA 3-end processing factor
VRHVVAVVELDALTVDLDEHGLCLPALGLWLDPIQQAPLAFVSHAHAALAAAGSGRVLASRETLAIAGALGAGGWSPDAIGWDEVRQLAVDPAFGGGVARLSLAPAGHMPGAAQLVLDYGDRRLVYTGEWSGEADAVRPAGAIVPCEAIVVTTTFALPIFRFDPPGRVLEALVEWCSSRLADGITPVVLAHTPGPAQLVVRALSARGLPVNGDDAVRRTCAAYEELGIVLGPVRPHEAGARGRAVVASPLARAAELRSRGRSEVAYASGWALLDAAVERKRANAAFALTDQVDFDGLLALVRACGARRVIATRGDARAFARLLASEGIEARALELPAIDARGDS